GGATQTPNSVFVTFPQLLPPIKLNHLVKQLNDRISDQQQNWLFKIGEKIQDIDETNIRNKQKLLCYVNYISKTWPAPLPQTLNLSFCFKVEATIIDSIPDKDLVFAAPILGTNAPTGNITIQSGLGTWDYKNVYRAYINAWEKSPTPPNSDESFIDLGSLWIKKQPTTWTGILSDFESENWLTNLENRLGTIFDLSRRLIDFFAANIDSQNFIQFLKARNNNGLKIYREAILCALRDTSIPGLLPEPNSQSAFD